jgi:hypothetical protein
MNKPLDEPMYPRRAHWERRRDVTRVLTERPEISDRRVAHIAVVSRELVRQVRRELVRKSLIQSCHALRRVGADGKNYELPRPKARVGT